MKIFDNISDYNDYLDEKDMISSFGYIISFLSFTVIGGSILDEHFSLNWFGYVLFALTLPIVSVFIVQISNYYRYYGSAMNLFFSSSSIIIFWNSWGYFTEKMLLEYISGDMQLYEFIITQLLIISFGAIIFGVIISIPFKIIDYFVFGSENFYYSKTTIFSIENQLKEKNDYSIEEPVTNYSTATRKQKSEKKYSADAIKKFQMKLQTKSEIELDIMLSEALKEELYEKAQLIQDVIERRFR